MRSGGLRTAQAFAWAALLAAGAWAASTPEGGAIALVQTQASEARAARWPFVTAAPAPEGALRDAQQARLFDESGAPVPAHFEALSYWTPDCESVKWLRLAFSAPVEAGRKARYLLRYGPSEAPAPEFAQPVKVSERDDGITVDTGAIRFVVSRREGGFLASVRRGRSEVYSPADMDGPYVVDQTGALFRARLDARPLVRVEEANPARVVVRAESWCVRDPRAGARGDSAAGARLTKCLLRYYAYAGEPWIELHWTFIVTADTEVTAFRDIGLRMTGGGRGVIGLTEGQAQEATPEAYLLQKKPRLYKVYERKAPSWAQVPGMKPPPPQWTESSRGRWAPGWAANRTFTLTMRDFAALFPKELYARTDRGWSGLLRSEIVLRAWPAHGEFNEDWFAEPATAPGPETPLDRIVGANGVALNALYFQNSQAWHHGPMLDFGLPDWWRNENIVGGPMTPSWLDAFAGGKGRAWEAEALCGRAALPGPVKFHAAGTSRTQELLLDFSGDRPEETRGPAAARRQLFADPPHIWLERPAWLAESRALPPADTAALERAEAAAQRARTLSADSERAGLWTWGSRPEFWAVNGAAGLSRMYGGEGLGPEGIGEWPLYMRTGDPDHLRAARAASAQWRDVHLVHYSTPAFQELPLESRKVPGAATAPSTYPWRGGAGGISRGEMLLWDYLLRGDRRSFEALELHADFLMRDTTPTPAGARVAAVRTLQAWYEFSWDPLAAARLKELQETSPRGR